MKMNDKQRENLAKFLWDVAKLNYGAFFLAEVFKVRVVEQYLVILFAVTVPAILGYLLDAGKDLAKTKNSGKKKGGGK